MKLGQIGAWGCACLAVSCLSVACLSVACLSVGCLSVGKYRVSDDAPDGSFTSLRKLSSTLDASPSHEDELALRPTNEGGVDAGIGSFTRDRASQRGGDPTSAPTIEHVSGETTGSVPDAGASDGGISRRDCGWAEPPASEKTQGCVPGRRYRQIGTDRSEIATAIAVAIDGSTWVVGITDGKFPGQPAGGSDVFVRGYSKRGEVVRTIQLQDDAPFYTPKIAATTSGSVIVARTEDTEVPNRLVLEAFDLSGVATWRRVIDGPLEVVAVGLNSDPTGGVFVTGWRQLGGTTDAGTRPGQSFVARVDAEGRVLWESDIPSLEPSEYPIEFDGEGVAAWSDGSVLVASAAFADLSAYPLGGRTKLTKFSANGEPLWQKLLDSAAFSQLELGTHLALNAAGEILVGAKAGFKGAVVKLTDAGELVWASELGASTHRPPEVTTDAAGNVYAAMTVDIVSTSEGYDGLEPNSVSNDVFVAGLDSQGGIRWSRQFGTTADDEVVGLSWHSNALYVCGTTWGEIETRYGDSDAFVVEVLP